MSRVLCGYDREEYETDSRVHPESAERESSIGPDDNEGIRRPVCGWQVTNLLQVADRTRALRRRQYHRAVPA